MLVRDQEYVRVLMEVATAPQTWMPAPSYLLVWITALISIVFVPTHLLLKKLYPAANTAG